ncbi:hypothetical protein [Kordiimonas sp.]|uniref:hypothetical protein n=1 Tax=Kordiimonas sp. TaxID=1970157 RepID=UPI003A94FF23
MSTAKQKTEKRCSHCREFLPLASFYRNASRPDGLANNCRDCTKAITKTVKARNQPSRRANWADGMLATLNIGDNEY